ncbi:MAG: PRC-barrel domain-containing protein [Gemmatimonadota bacterium]
MNSTTPAGLAAFNELPDYRVCRDDTDPRGWSVVDSGGVPVGVATDLIIDLEPLIARYIVCSTARAAKREVLIPIGFARLDEDSETVHLDFVIAAAVDTLPTYTGLPLSDEFSARLETALTGEAKTSPEAIIVRRTDATRNAS